MKVLSKNEAAFQLLKVVANAIDGSKDVIALASELEGQGAPRDLVNDVLETTASIVIDEAYEAIKNILEVL